MSNNSQKNGWSVLTALFLGLIMGVGVMALINKETRRQLLETWEKMKKKGEKEIEGVKKEAEELKAKGRKRAEEELSKAEGKIKETRR